jgi:hypothetical protein
VSAPAATMAAYCAAVGLPFIADSLHWEPGHRPEWAHSSRCQQWVRGASPPGPPWACGAPGDRSIRRAPHAVLRGALAPSTRRRLFDIKSIPAGRQRTFRSSCRLAIRQRRDHPRRAVRGEHAKPIRPSESAGNLSYSSVSCRGAGRPPTTRRWGTLPVPRGRTPDRTHDR